MPGGHFSREKFTLCASRRLESEPLAEAIHGPRHYQECHGFNCRSRARTPMKKAVKYRTRASVLVLGDIIGDVIGRAKAWPEPGDDCLAPRLEMHCGGVAANCAFAFAGRGVRPLLLGCVGRDDFGAYLLRLLRAAGVDVRCVQRTSKAMTGLLYVNVTPDGQRTFFGSRAANSLVRQVARGSTFYRGAAGAHLVGYNFLDPSTEEAARKLIRIVRARGGWIALDVGASPSQHIPRKMLQLCRDVEMIRVNRGEAAALTGTRDARKALRRLQRRGARHVVVKW